MAAPKLIFNKRLDLLRFIMLAISLLVPVSATLYREIGPFDALFWTRSAMSILGLLSVAISYRLKVVKEHYQQVFHFVGVLYVAWIAWAYYANGLPPNIAGESFLILFALATGLAGLKELRIFCISFVLILSTALLISNGSESLRYVLVAELLILAAILYVFFSGFLVIMGRVRETNQNFSALINSLDESLLLLDDEARIMEFNTHASNSIQRLFDEEIKKGNTVMKYFSDEDRETFASNFERGLRSHQKMEEHLVLPDGRRIWHEINYHPVKDISGASKGVLLSVLNIDDRKREREKMKLLSRITATTVGDDFFSSISTSLGEMMGTDYVVIAELKGNPGKLQMQTLAFSGKGKHYPPINTQLKGSSCERIIQHGSLFHPNHAMRSVPDSHLVQRLGIEGFYGITLSNLKGKPIGVLIFLHGQPLPHSFNIPGPIVNLIISRIESEILRKKASAKLVRSEIRYRTILENTNEVIFSTDGKGIVNYLSPNFQKYFGLPPSDLLHRHLHELAHPADKGKVTDLVSGMLQGDQPQFRAEIRFKVSAENHQWYSLSASPLFDDDNTQRGLTGIMLNINERKRTEEIVRQSEEHFRQIFEAAPIGMVIVGRRGRIMSVNSSFTNTLGYESTELVGTNILSLSDDDDRDQNTLSIKRLYRGEIPDYQVERKYTHKLGHSIFTIVRVSLLRSKGINGSGLLVQVLDISERKAAEELLQKQNKDLEKINGQMDHFVYSSAHDLRAPLRSVLGLISVIKLEQDTSNLETYLGMMEKSILKLDDFIGDIVDFSRNSRVQMNPQRLDIAQLVEEAYASLRHHSSAKNIDLTIEVDNVHFITDKMRLLITLNNLLSNAIRYSDSHKPRTMINVAARERNGRLVLSVHDNGIGIDSKFKDRIFEMFFRASEVAKGSGLGLYIVHEAVKALGGSIQVESELGQGTTFTIDIPEMPIDSKKTVQLTILDKSLS